MNIELKGDNFELSFKYKPSIVDRIRQIPGRRFDGARKVWIVCIHEIGQNDLAGMSSAGDWCGGDIAHPECQMVSPFLLSEGV